MACFGTLLRQTLIRLGVRYWHALGLEAMDMGLSPEPHLAHICSRRGSKIGSKPLILPTFSVCISYDIRELNMAKPQIWGPRCPKWAIWGPNLRVSEVPKWSQMGSIGDG
jgi:hypothetical protein